MNKSTAPPLQSSILCAIIIVIAHNGTTDNSIAAKNPFTYRGYYYDSDIRLYYLQTRYYDSVTGRFINADGYVSTGQGILGNNMFAYCGNNPVMFVDPTGEWPKFVDDFFGGVKEFVDSVIGYVEDAFTYDAEIIYDETNKNFKFEENEEYSVLNAYDLAKQMKSQHYSNDNTRTVMGLYIELQVHYVLYKVGNSHGTDGAHLGSATWSEDPDAYIIEQTVALPRKMVNMAREILFPSPYQHPVMRYYKGVPIIL